MAAAPASNTGCGNTRGSSILPVSAQQYLESKRMASRPTANRPRRGDLSSGFKSRALRKRPPVRDRRSAGYIGVETITSPPLPGAAGTAGRSSAWKSAWFGTRKSQVQILSSRRTGVKAGLMVQPPDQPSRMGGSGGKAIRSVARLGRAPPGYGMRVQIPPSASARMPPGRARTGRKPRVQIPSLHAA